jgi:EAL domain-containing protein (putative c-di-GMP-specific phosphodiesterase class I)
VAQLASSGTGRTMTETIITLGKAFNMTTLAEGVETTEQFEMLANLGCDQTQGYLHSRPLAAVDIEPFLKPAHSPSSAGKSNGANLDRTAAVHGG